LTARIRIGNQTASVCADRMTPFAFAVEHGFDAFEWFADKKFAADGSTSGWEEDDIDAATRAWIAQTGRERDVLFTVHAPWQANPLHPGGVERLLRSLDFAQDIGASIVNLHLYMDDGPAGFVHSLRPVLTRASKYNLRLSIENTPHTSPDDFNATFAAFGAVAQAGTVGMCLDLGHANLCAATRNDYIGFIDALQPIVPLIHLHVHEKYGDADSHLTLFTGPARDNDAGVRAFVARLRRRRYSGPLILEQWPNPAELLTQAATRLRRLLDCVAS
jgi:sugar phosphate isomerase/epimerase